MDQELQRPWIADGERRKIMRQAAGMGLGLCGLAVLSLPWGRVAAVWLVIVVALGALRNVLAHR